MKSYHGLLLAVLALLVSALIGQESQLIERYYSRGFYLFLRKLYDLIDSVLVVPGILLAIFFVIVVPIWRAFAQKRSWQSKLKTLVNVIGWIIFLFYLLWGFNYQRIPYVKQTQLDMVAPSDSLLTSEVEETIQKLSVLRHRQVWRRDSSIEMRSLQELLSDEMGAYLSSVDYPADFAVRVRIWKLKGLLLRFSTAGIYIPHSLEGNVDGGLHALQLPFTSSHEMVHAFGITHEGVANLCAYMACSKSENIYVRYCAELAYFRYLLSDLRRSDQAAWEEVWERLDPLIVKDLQDIRKQMDKYPDLIPKIRNKVYDSYLKQHGMADGLLSYSQMVKLVMSEKARASTQFVQ